MESTNSNTMINPTLSLGALVLEVNNSLKSLEMASPEAVLELYQKWVGADDKSSKWFGIESSWQEIEIIPDRAEVNSYKLILISQILAMQDFRTVGVLKLSFNDRVLEGNVRKLWLHRFQDMHPFGDRIRFVL